MPKSKTFIGLGLAVLFAAGGYYLWGTDNAKVENRPAVNISAAPVQRRDVPIAVSLVGNVIAYESVTIKSRIDSQIVEVLFRDGDAVTEGQVLFKLDDRALRAQIRELEASVRKERAQLENARLQYERSKALVQNDFVSQSQADTSKAAFESQQAALKATEASLENARVLLSYCTIRAPISGRAGTINVTLGNTVKANDTQALVTINRISPIGVQFAIPERYYAQVREAMSGGAVPVRAVRRTNAEEITGKLEYIDNTINTTTGAFLARANFANKDESLWPGMFLNVSIELGKEAQVLTIPAVAVQGDQEQHYVFRIVGGKAVRTPVEISSNDGTLAIVSKGLQAGETVITDGLLRVTEGAPVAVVPATAAPVK